MIPQLTEDQRKALNRRVGYVSGLMTLRARPRLDGEWMSPQQANVESALEGAFTGLSLQEMVVVLTKREVEAIFGHELDPEEEM